MVAVSSTTTAPKVEASEPALTLARLKEVLSYDPVTGVFRWLPRPVRPEFLRTDRGFNTRCAGKIAGCDNGKGYLVIEIDAVGYKAHRLAWLYMTGRWPKDQIDHKNRRRSDNRIENLREATVTENDINGARPHRRVAPYRGLGFNRQNTNKPWNAKIAVNKKRISLGYFATPEEAHAAYCAAAKKHHGEFASFD